MTSAQLKRHLAQEIMASLEHFPVVLITGARQVGKSTLAQELTRQGWNARYLTLDNRTILDAALNDPDGFIDGADGAVIIDEVQRAPELMRAIKLAVDRDRKAGKFLITGSANLMTLSKVSETLAGRIALHELQPFSWPETCGKKSPELLKSIFSADDAGTLLKKWKRYSFPDRREEIKARIIAGGYPVPSMMSSIKLVFFSKKPKKPLSCNDFKAICHFLNLATALPSAD